MAIPSKYLNIRKKNDVEIPLRNFWKMMSGSFRDIDFFSYRKKGSKFLKVVNKKNCVNTLITVT